jgi:hypothetical protein
MSWRVREEEEIQIIRAYLRGDTRDPAATDAGRSAGKVSDIWTRFKSIIGTEGIILRNLAINLRKLDVTAKEASDGARIVSTLKKFGVTDLSRVETSLSKALSSAIEQKLDPGEFVEHAKTPGDLEGSMGMTFGQINKKFEDLQTSVRKLEDKERKLQENISLLDQESTRKMREKKVTLQNWTSSLNYEKSSNLTELE